MLDWLLLLIGAGVADGVLNKEDEEIINHRYDCYKYYNEFIEYYLDEARTKIKETAQEYRSQFGCWPNVKNLNYTKKNLEEPECVDGAVNLSYLGTYDHSEFYKNLRREINLNWITYDNKSGLDEVSNDFDILDDFYYECEKELGR